MQEGDAGGRGSDWWGAAWYSSTAQITDQMDVVSVTSRPSLAFSMRKPSCFRRRCWRSAADSDTTMNFSTSSAAKQAISSQEFMPHLWNICVSSALASAPGKPNNQTNEASMVMGAARSFIGVILVDSESEWDAPTADDHFEGEDMTINKYNG